MHTTTRMIFGAFLLLGLAAGAPCLHAQAAEMGLRLDVDKREVEVGGSVHLTIEFRRMGSGNVSVVRHPSIATPELFEIRGTTSSTQVTMDGQKMVEISTTKVVLVATKEGTETLGPAVMVYQVPGGDPQEIKSNGVMITVVGKSGLFGRKKKEPAAKRPREDANALPAAPPSSPPAAPPEDIRDIKPLLGGMGWTLRALFWVILAILGVWLASRLVSRLLSRKRETAPAKDQAVRLRERWRRLASQELEGKEYSLVISALLRECLEYRHGFPAPDLTTREVLRSMKRAGASPENIEKTEKCLRACDGVLYADGNLTLKDRQTLRSIVGDFLPRGN